VNHTTSCTKHLQVFRMWYILSYDRSTTNRINGITAF